MKIPFQISYIALFLTMKCDFHCPYCVNWNKEYKEIDASYWIKNLNRIETDLPVTLCGGEPSLYEGFFDIINNIPQKVDILTNLSFDVNEFIRKVKPDRFDNDKSFAPIRVSFHYKKSNKDDIINKFKILVVNGFRVGLYFIDIEQHKNIIEEFKAFKWIDVQTKPMLNNAILNYEQTSPILCRSKELLLAPDGKVYKCHRDLYKQEENIDLLEEINYIDYKFRECINSNECHPCDTKIKRDRFGNFGYCAIEKTERLI